MTAAKRRATRGAVPEHLPRIETTIDVEDKACPCCSGTLHLIGEDRAEHWAVLASLIETAKLNDIDPQAYITDVITRIVGGLRRAGSTSWCPGI